MSNRVRINNHTDRIIPLRRPYPGGKSGLIVPMTAFNSQTVVLNPHKSEYIDFWDEIKDHPIIQNYLDRHKLSVGENEDPREGDGDPYTSFGDTMVAADSLNPDIDDEEAEDVMMQLERENEQPKKKPGRRSKKQAQQDQPSGQNFEQN